jgi:hypothetical protein
MIPSSALATLHALVEKLGRELLRLGQVVVPVLLVRSLDGFHSSPPGPVQKMKL